MSDPTPARVGPLYPPVLIRGVIRLVTRPDWLSLSVPVAASSDTLGHAYGLLSHVEPGPSTHGRGFWHYADVLRADSGGASVLYHGLGDAEGTATLNLTGAWWERCPDIGAALELVGRLEGNVTRFDLCADFSGPDVPTIAGLAAAVRAGEWVTRLRTATLTEDLAARKGTVYLGSAASDRRLRLYDTRGPLRVEFRYRDTPAVDLMADTAARGATAAHTAALRARVDFPTVAGWSDLLAAA